MNNQEYLFSFDGTNDPFDKHRQSSIFVEAAFVSKELTGSYKIGPKTRDYLMDEFQLGEGLTAALAYLAEKRAEEASERLELEIGALTYESGDYL